MTDEERDEFLEILGNLHKVDCAYIPYQKCPICEGSGKTLVREDVPNTFSRKFETCSVCKGYKIIAMHKQKNVKDLKHYLDQTLAWRKVSHEYQEPVPFEGPQTEMIQNLFCNKCGMSKDWVVHKPPFGTQLSFIKPEDI